MAALLSVVTLLIFLIEDVYGEYCKRNSYFTNLYCPYGCCGSYFNRYCCSYTNIPLIAGCTIVGIIVFIIIVVCICACVKSGTRPGRVIGNTQVMTVTAAATTSQVGAIQQPPPYNAYSAGSGAQAYPPPGSGPVSAAYPPTGYQQNPQGFQPPLSGFQTYPPPPPNYKDLNTQQPFSYGAPQ